MKVVYKPVRRFREEGGLLSKSVTYTYKQVTEIMNSRSEPAVITFVDQVPKSQDEKLKVRFMIRAVSQPNGLTLNQITAGLSPTLLTSNKSCLSGSFVPRLVFPIIQFQWLRMSAISSSRCYFDLLPTPGCFGGAEHP